MTHLFSTSRRRHTRCGRDWSSDVCSSDLDGPATHTVTAPAEHDGVDPPRQNPSQQHLALLLVERPAHDEVHQAGKLYPEGAYKTKECRLRRCEARSGGLDLVDLGRQHEVVLGQPAGGVRPEVDPERAVGEVEVW